MLAEFDPTSVLEVVLEREPGSGSIHFPRMVTLLPRVD